MTTDTTTAADGTPAPAETDIVRRNYGLNHGYKVAGVKWPGVTTITHLAPKDALTRWASRATADKAINEWARLSRLPLMARHRELMKAADEDRDAAAGRGRQVHVLGARLFAGEDITGRVPEPIKSHVEQYCRALDTLKIVPAAPPEVVIANRTRRYCGTLDLLGDIPRAVPVEGEYLEPGRWLIDVKTSRSGIFMETALQVCGYESAELFIADTPDGKAERPFAWLGPIHQRGCLWVRSDGWDLIPLATGADVWAYFTHLAGMWWLGEDSRDWVGPAAGPWH